MKPKNILLILCVILFYHLFSKFLELGGWNHSLLKIMMELILIVFFMILLKYKKEIMEISDYEFNQKKYTTTLPKKGNK